MAGLVDTMKRVHETMLENAKARLDMWYKRFKEHPEFWEDPGMCRILGRAEEDVDKLTNLVKLERKTRRRHHAVKMSVMQ